ncbi:MAG: GNAT family N-acetyltransferase [Candidatus Heimdallarchaeaceae archaeon]
MIIESRYFDVEHDFERVMSFFIESFKMKDNHQHWVPTRFENEIFANEQCEERIKLWEKKNTSNENEDSKIVGLVILKQNSYILFTYSNFKFLEKEMIAWAEKSLKERNNNERKELKIVTIALEDDKERKTLLSELKYQKGDVCGHIRIKKVLPPQSYSLPEGFEIRSLKDEDYPKYIKALEIVFNHSFFTEEVFRAMRETTTFYNPDLNLGVFDSAGNLAAFCMVRIDPISRIAEYEPVGTLPKYRRLGLAKALMIEGLKRSKQYEPTMFYVAAAHTEQAAKFYENLGFDDKIEVYCWEKIISLD